MDRAYGILEFRSVDDDLRIIEGVASSDTLDDHGTILEPSGARFSVPFPLLWQHDSHSPVGEVIEAHVEGNKIIVRAQIRKIPEAGAFKDLTDKAWQGVKHGLVRGFSVGFLPVKTVKNRFTEWAMRELSLVTIPSNQDATINLVRSSFAASGDSSPGVSGTQTPLRNSIPKRTMTIAEQIQAYESRKAELVTRKDALLDATATETRVPTAEENAEFENIESEVRSIDAQVTRLNGKLAANAATATPVVARNIATASATRAGEAAPARETPRVLGVRANVEPGIGMARMVMALYQADGDKAIAESIARRNWPDQADEIGIQLRAAVAAGNTTDATWASPLVQPSTLASEFLEMLRPRTLLGRIPNLGEVPFNTRVGAQTGTGTYGWVGEGRPKPLTSLAFAALTLAHNKVAGIIAITDELLRFSNPKAEQRVRDDMLAGIPRFLDGQFVDPAITAIAGVRPASITNGITGFAATGTTEATAYADIGTLISGFDAAYYDTEGLVILMHSQDAYRLGRLRNADTGTRTFDGLTLAGGTLEGVPVITSGTPALLGQIIAIHAPSILIADDENVTIDMSREASVQMESAPTHPADATTVTVSFWQHNMVGFRAERYVTWLRGRADAVRRITSVAYA